MTVRYGTAGGETMLGSEGDDSLFGRSGNDFLYGLAGRDSLNGGNGDDLLDGGTGLDLLRGGLGNDIYVVDALHDRVVENTGEGFDTVRAMSDYTLAPGASIEVLTTNHLAGTEPFALSGNEFDNRIMGNSGDNVLQGGDGNDSLAGRAGNDILDGGPGVDLLVGGGGHDEYLFTDTTSHDVISGFESGVDHIDLSYVIDDSTFWFIGDGAFTHNAGDVRFDNGVVEIDRDGDGVADFWITLNNVDHIESSDFTFNYSSPWDY